MDAFQKNLFTNNAKYLGKIDTDNNGKSMNIYQKNLFSKETIKLIREKTVLSVGYNQHEIIQGILDLHCEGKNVEKIKRKN